MLTPKYRRDFYLIEPLVKRAQSQTVLSDMEALRFEFALWNFSLFFGVAVVLGRFSFTPTRLFAWSNCTFRMSQLLCSNRVLGIRVTDQRSCAAVMFLNTGWEMTNIKLNVCREDCDMLGYLLGGFFVGVFWHTVSFSMPCWLVCLG